VVNYVNISEVGKITNSSSDFDKYVWSNHSFENITLNLTSNSYANLSLFITSPQGGTIEESNIHLKVQSRTERVYTRTFYLKIEEQL
jgi:hypothetical protein